MKTANEIALELKEVTKNRPEDTPFSMSIRYFDLNNKYMYFMTTRSPTTADQMVARLFDLSHQGYYINRVNEFYTSEDTWMVFLVLNRGIETNIDSNVMKEIVDILSQCKGK